MERVRKLSPKQVYLRAARRVDASRYQFSCSAITYTIRVGDDRVDEDLSEAYNRVFNPSSNRDPVGGYEWANRIEREPKPKELRVLMLCLMAECWKDFV